MLHQCLELGDSLLQMCKHINWKATHLKIHEVTHVPQKNQYFRLTLELRRSMTLDRNGQNQRLYKIAFQQINDEFESLERREENCNLKVNLFMEREELFQAEWGKTVQDVCDRLGAMTFNERKILIEKLEKGKRIATEVIVEINKLRVEADEMSRELDEGIRDCITRVMNLRSRVRLELGIGEE